MDIDIRELEAQLNKRIKEIEEGSLRLKMEKAIRAVCLSILQKESCCRINEEESDLVSGRIVFDILPQKTKK